MGPQPAHGEEADLHRDAPCKVHATARISDVTGMKNRRRNGFRQPARKQTAGIEMPPTTKPTDAARTSQVMEPGHGDRLNRTFIMPKAASAMWPNRTMRRRNEL